MYFYVMKHQLICLIIVFIAVNYSISQNNPAFTFETAIGLNASQISGDGTHSFAQFGAQFGGMLTYQKSERFQYTGGLLFSQKGARKYQSADNISTYRLRTNYVDVPIELQYRFKDFYFTIGPSFNFLVNHKERTNFGPTETEREFKFFELSGQGGVGYQIKEKWNIRLNYQNSILPVRDHDGEFFFPPTNSVIVETYHKLYNFGQYHSLFTLQLRYRI